MKLLLIICPEERAGDVRALIDRHEVHGYTEISEARGSGETGRHMGTRAFPGTVCLTITAIADTKVDELVEALQEFCRACGLQEGLKTFALDAARLI